jgi:hypothetical protein
MGNKSCYSNIRRRIRNNTSQHPYDKTPEQNQRTYEITPIDIKQKHFIDLFLVPYYNIEILPDDFNTEQECGICFEYFHQKDIIARLECLCIYHKKCLDEWGQRKRCCPLHMQDEKQQPETSFYILNQNSK